LAHARRKFLDLVGINKAPIAHEAVKRHRCAVAIERDVNSLAGGSGGWRCRGSCVGGFTSFNCVTRWGPAGDPYVRVVPRPVDEAEKARLVACDRKWLERCNPIVERDRYGVGRLRYAAPGCEFGVSED
jgi:hypothetical protein